MSYSLGSMVHFGIFLLNLVAYILWVSGFRELSFVASIIAFVSYIFVTYKVRGKYIIHLDTTFYSFLFIYSITLPLSNEINPKIELASNVIFVSYSYCLLALIGFSFATIFHGSLKCYKETISSSTNLQFVNLKRVRSAALFIFVVGLLSSFLAVQLTVGFDTYLSAGYAGRSLIKREAGPIELGLYISVIGLILLVIVWRLSEEQSKLFNYLMLVAVIVFVGYVSFLGVRRPAFLLILSLLTCYALIGKRRISLIKVAVISIPLLLFFTTFAQYRQLLSSDGLIYTIHFIVDNASIEWLDFSDTELGAPFKTLYHYVESDLSPRYWGFTYLMAVPYSLPTILSGGVQSLSVLYTNTFFSQEFISIGGNMGFFPVTEAYLNFGPAGIPAVFVIFSLLLGIANKLMYQRRFKNPFLLVFFCILIPWCAFFMRLDFASFSKGFLYSQLIPIFCALIYYKISFKK